MFPNRLPLVGLGALAAFGAINLSGHTTVPQAAAAVGTTSSTMACLCNGCDGDVTSFAHPLVCDGEVDVNDLLKVLADQGKVCGVDISPLGDANRDGVVDSDDTDTVLAAWGSCP